MFNECSDRYKPNYPFVILIWLKMPPHAWQIGVQQQSKMTFKNLVKQPTVMEKSRIHGVQHHTWLKVNTANSQPHSRAMQIPQNSVKIL